MSERIAVFQRIQSRRITPHFAPNSRWTAHNSNPELELERMKRADNKRAKELRETLQSVAKI